MIRNFPDSLPTCQFSENRRENLSHMLYTILLINNYCFSIIFVVLTIMTTININQMGCAYITGHHQKAFLPSKSSSLQNTRKLLVIPSKFSTIRQKKLFSITEVGASQEFSCIKGASSESLTINNKNHD